MTGCGFAQSKGQLIAFRFLAGLGGSAPLSVCVSPKAEDCVQLTYCSQIGGGVIGDLFTPEQRGQAIAIYSLAPLVVRLLTFDRIHVI